MKTSKTWSVGALWRQVAWLWGCVVMVGLAACSDGGGEAPSAPTPPTITAQPADTQVTAGSAARFSVTADGANLAYQWQRSNDSGATWTGITSALTASYTLATPAVTDSGSRFRVLVSSGSAQTISSAASLTVSALVVAPGITVQPQPAQVTEGANASFSVTATGTALAYRWQTSPDGSDWTDATSNATGGTTPTLTLNAVTLRSNPLQVRVLVSNSLATATSDTVRLTVLPAPAAPTFTAQPAAATVVAPNTATFTVVVGGTPAPTLQWQRSTDGGSSYNNISGATASSFTTAATSVSDSGTRYRTVASNASGTLTSNPATLTVTAAPMAPAVTTDPADTTAALGAVATFNGSFSGNPAPALQWQISTDGGLTFANINGATSASFTLTTAATDNGRRYRVVATNSQGTATSRAALLSVQAAASVFSGRAWTLGQMLDQSLLITAGANAIDDQGRVTVLYSKVVSDRLVLHAVRGTPGGVGSAPVFGTPVALETGIVGDPAVVSQLAISPSGNVLAAWNHREPCGATTCVNLYTARYRVATGQWEARTLVPGAAGQPTSLAINDSGDVMLLVSLTAYWQAQGATGYASQTWPLTNGTGLDVTAFTPQSATLDNAGRMVVAGSLYTALTRSYDIVAYRGDARSGLGAAETVDLRGASATFNQLLSNPSGQSVLLWAQDNGVRATVYAATLDTAAGSWVVTDTGQAPPTAGTSIPAALSDDGNFIRYFYGNCTAQRRTAGNWSNPTALPATLCQSTGVPGTPTLARNGNLITLHPSDGSWLAYDALLDQVFNPLPHAASGPGYLLGFSKLMSAVPGNLLLAHNGTAAYVSINSFNVLPTATLPNGDSGGPHVWAWYFR